MVARIVWKYLFVVVVVVVVLICLFFHMFFWILLNGLMYWLGPINQISDAQIHNLFACICL